MRFSVKENNKPQIKAPRVTHLEGVSTHGTAMCVCGVENPQGSGIDERRLNDTVQSPQRTQRTQSSATIIFATFALFAVRCAYHFNMLLNISFEAFGGA